MFCGSRLWVIEIVRQLPTSNSLSPMSTTFAAFSSVSHVCCNHVACCNVGAGPASDCALEGSAGTGSGQQETALESWWPQGPGSSAHGHGEVPPHGPPARDVSATTPSLTVPPSAAPSSTVSVSQYCNNKEHVGGCSCLLSLCLPVAECDHDGHVSSIDQAAGSTFQHIN